MANTSKLSSRQQQLLPCYCVPDNRGDLAMEAQLLSVGRWGV